MLILVVPSMLAYAALDDVRLLGFPHPRYARWSAALVALLSAVVAGFVTRHIHRELNPDDSPGRPQMSVEDPLDFVERIRRVGTRYGAELLGLFEAVLTHPELYIARAVEEASVQENTLQLDVRLTFDVHQAREVPAGSRSADVFVIPFIRMRKGQLIDNLDVREADGSTLATLSQAETRALTAHVVTNLYWKAYVDPGSPCSVSDIEGSDAKVWNTLLRIVLNGETLSEKLLESIESLLDDAAVKDQLAHTTLVKLITFLGSHYVIAASAPVGPDDRVVINYSKTLPCYAQYETVRDKVRLLAGLRPYRFTVPLWLPYFAASYHFRMQGVGGQYVVSHSLFRPKEQTVVRQEDFKDLRPRPYIRVRHRRALPYAHLYMRDFRSAKPTDLETIVRFGETPPGALGGTTLVAWASAGLMAVFTFLSAASGAQASSDIPALLLASPAFAASLLGYTTDSESLLRTSLTARLGLAATGILSFCSAALYLLRANGHLVARWKVSLFGGLVRFKGVSPYWLGLSTASGLTALYLAAMTFARTRAYIKEIGKFKTGEDVYGLD